MTSEDPAQYTKKKVCTVCKREFPPTQAVCPYDKSMLMYLQKDELLGTVLNDRYRVINEVGRGGMSIVYKGLHEMMDRTVAIKMLQAQHVTDQLSIKRFQQEAQAASHLQHPHVITVYDCGVVATGQPYIVMDFLEGESLSDLIKKDNHIAYQRAIPIFAQACDALDHAHQKGVIHRDLKSSNIMLVEVEGRKDFVKVVDFGIAKLTNASGKAQQNLTQTGEIFGSPIYMSPEQCLGQQLDSRSDIYSMGAVLYEALTGLPPLMGDTIYATMKMHVSQMPESFNVSRPDLRIPEQIERIAFKALAKKPEQRFQSMQEFRDALEECMRTQFDTGAMPSLLSAPPAVGFNTLSSGSKEFEDFDLSGGLFGDEPPPSGATTFKDKRDTFTFTPSGGNTQERTPTIRGTRPPSSMGETSRRTVSDSDRNTGRSTGRSTGVRKPAADRRVGRDRHFEMPAFINKRNMLILACMMTVPMAIYGLIYLGNQLGNDNPLLITKKYEGTIYYYEPPNTDASGQTTVGSFYVKTAPPKTRWLKVDLGKFDITNHISSTEYDDVKVGAIWDLNGPMGPNNSLVLENGQYLDKSDLSMTAPRKILDQFICFIRDNRDISGLLANAYKLTSEHYQKDNPPQGFQDKFSKEPDFKETFKEKALPPGSLLVTDLKPASINILVNGHLFLNPNTAGATPFYKVTLVLQDGQWKIDTFEPVAEQFWKEHLPK